MNRGYAKIWRKVLDSGWLKQHKLWAFWGWCILKASYKEFDAIVGLQRVHLMPGQFIFGRKKASDETGLSEQEIRTIIKFLVKCENLTIKSTNKYSIITIVNWGTYQGYDEDHQPSNQPKTNQQVTTYKNIRNKEYNITQFDKFYQMYPRKQGKQAALKAWLKNPELSNGLFDTLMDALKKQKTSIWKNKDKQFIPYPGTWINGRRWEDEIEDSKQTPGGWL